MAVNEQDLAKPVVAWLEDQHWDVYQEVQVHRGGRIADIVAVRNKLVWIIECKKTFSLAVMEQASYWHVHYRSVAIPQKKQGRNLLAERVAKDYFGLGVLTVSDFRIEETIAAPIKREFHRFAKTVQAALKPEHKTYALAGSKHAGYFTPYKQTMGLIRKYIEQHPGCTLKEIVVYIGRGHYANSQSARGNIRISLLKWESSWCFINMSTKPHTYFLKDQQL